MVCLSIFILLGLYKLISSQCLIYKEDSTAECLECYYTYYYNFSLPYQGGKSAFPITDCKLRNKTTMNFEIFISPLAPISSEQDGSQYNPYSSLFEALMAGWRRANPFNKSNLSFKLLGNGLNGDLEASSFYMDSFDYPFSSQYLFRALYANIIIEPAYCNSTFLAFGCIKNKELKPKIFWRTESLYIFTSRSLTLNSIILDGRDLHVAGLINKTNKNATLCSSDQELEKQIETVPNSSCGRQKFIVKSEYQAYGVFNIEQQINYDYIIDKPILSISNSAVQNFLPVTSTASVACLVRMQLLAFDINIQNSTFLRNYFSEGVLSSSTFVPPHFASISLIYLILRNDFEQSNNTVFISDSSFSLYNYYEVNETNAIWLDNPVSMLNLLIWTNLNISNSQFSQNKGLFSASCSIEVGSLIQYSLSNESSFFYVKVNFRNLKVIRNSGTYFFYGRNINFGGNTDESLKINDVYFEGNLNFAFYFKADFFGSTIMYITNLYVFNHTLYTTSFFRVQNINFNIFINNFQGSNLMYHASSVLESKFRTFVDFSIESSYTEDDVFSVLRSENDTSLDLPLLKLVDCTFKNLFTTLVLSRNDGIIEKLSISSSNFSSIFLESGSLFKFSVEKIISLNGVNFSNVYALRVFDLKYGRNISFERLYAFNLTGSIFKITLWQGQLYQNYIIWKSILTFVYSTYPSFFMKDCLFVDIFLLGNGISTEQILIESVYNISIYNVTLRNINGVSDYMFLSSYYICATIRSINVENMQTISFLSLVSSEILIPLGKLTFYRRNTSNIIDITEFYIDSADRPLPFGDLIMSDIQITQGLNWSGYFLFLKDFYFLSLNNSTFQALRPGRKNRTAALWISSTFGAFLIKESSFLNLSSLNGGALFISVFKFDNFTISNCAFTNNSGFDMGGDIIIKIISKLGFDGTYSVKSISFLLPDWPGIQNCSFSSSKGGIGGSITLLEYGQLYLKNCSFNHSFAKSGGAIYLMDKTTAIIIDSSFLNLWAEDHGGAISCYGFYIYLAKIRSENLRATWGAFLFQNGGNVIIRDFLINKSVADFGGTIYALSSYLVLKNTRFQSLKATSSGGAIFGKKSYLYAKNSYFINCSASYQGSALYFNMPAGLSLIDIHYQSSRAGEGGIYVSVKLNKNSFCIIEDLTCAHIFGIGKGACLFGSDINLILKRSLLENNNIEGNLIHLASNLDSQSISFLEQISSLNNKNSLTTIFASRTILTAKSFIIKKNLFKDTNLKASVLFLEQGSNATLEHFYYDNLFTLETLLQAQSSLVKIFNFKLYMNDVSAGFFFQECQEILIAFSVLIRGSSSDYAGGITSMNSKLTIFYSTLTNNQGLLGGGIYTKNSILILANSVLLRNAARVNGSALYNSGSELLFLTNVSILDQKGSSLFMNDIKTIRMYKITLKLFIKGEGFSQGMYFLDPGDVAIEKSNFSGFQGRNAICFISSLDFNNTVYLLISDSMFENNNCEFSGGAIFLDSPFLMGSIVKSLFFNNTSEINGGAIHYRCSSLLCKLEIKSCNFLRNRANVYSSVVKADHLTPFFLNNSYSENVAIQGSPPLVLFPSKILLFQGFDKKQLFFKALANKGFKGLSLESTSILKKITSGRDSTIACLITDELGNFFQNENYSSLSFKVISNSEINIQNGMEKINNGVAFFSNLQINAWPGKDFEIMIEYKNDLEGYFFNQTVRIEVRNCIKGEIVSGLICKTCTEKFYSLDPNPIKLANENISEKICEACPENAFCPGGKVIIPSRDYWIRNENQSASIKCPVKGACEYIEPYKMSILELETYAHSPKCNPGYFGNLCYNCREGYGRSSDKSCIKCTSSTFVYIKFFLIGFLTLTFMLYQSRTAFSLTIIESKRRALIKIIVDHVTYVSFVSRFNIRWSAYIYDFFAINDQFTTTASREVFNFDCFISSFVDEKDTYIWNSTLVSFSPLFYGLVLLLYLYLGYFLIFLLKKLLFLIKKRHIIKFKYIPLKKNILSICIIIFYNFYHRLILNSLNLLRCQQIDQSEETYLETNPDLLCWADLHLTYFFSISVPGIVIWGVGAPLILLIITIRMSKRKKEAANKGFYNNLLSFLTIDYVNDLYYWEFFTYFSKFIIVSSTLASSRLEPVSQGALLILICLSMFLIHQAMKPYRFGYINNFKTYSYMTAIFTSALAIMAANEQSTEVQRNIFIWAVLIVNIMFYMIWFSLVMRGIKVEMLELFKQIRDMFILIAEKRRLTQKFLFLGKGLALMLSTRGRKSTK